MPNPAVDTMIVTYGAFVVTSDICRTYHVRAGFFGTVLIMAHALGNMYLGGHLEEASESFFDALLEEKESLMTTVFGKLSSKVAEGAVNGLLLYRLGKTVAGLVRPAR